MNLLREITITNQNKRVSDKAKNKIGIYGGTFDPIHLGHLITARSVMEIRKLSEIIFIPAYKSPLKLDVNSASSDNRFTMTKKAVEKYNNFSVSDYEIKKNDISYTINTIKHFKEKYDNIELIIGYDNFLIFDKWYKSDEILDLVDIVVLRRFYEEAVKPKVNSDKFIFVETPTIQISSTVIRDRIAKNLPIDFLVTPEIQSFIESEGLYKE